MDNRVYRLTKNEFNLIKNNITSMNKAWIVEIDGRLISGWKDYAYAIEKFFQFPTPCDKNYDVYLDWIRDLDWLEANQYVLIINSFNEFMKDDITMKTEIINDFSEIILPWWQNEVEQCVVEGKAKPFTVYLVD